MPNQFVNPGFEAGNLTGWTQGGSGTFAAVTGNGSISAAVGAYCGSIHIADSVNSDGGNLRQSIVLAAGDTIQFKYAIEWLDTSPYHLYVTVKVFQGATLVDTPVNFSTESGPSPDYFVSSWLNGSWQATNAGTYTLEFKVFYTDPGAYGGWLLVDDINVIADIVNRLTTGVSCRPYIYPVPRTFFNGGFESGNLTAWENEGPGTFTAVTTSFSGLLPVSGTYLAKIRRSYASPTTDSFLRQDVSLVSGETVSFKYAIEWGDAAPNHVFAKINIIQGGALVQTVVDFSTSTGPSADYFESGWLDGSWVVPSDGVYTLEFQLGDFTPDNWGVELLIDDVTIISAGAVQTLDTTVACTPDFIYTYQSNPYAFTNGGFELGNLQAWTTAGEGSFSVVTSSGSLAPATGTYFGVIQHGWPNVSGASLSRTITLGEGQLVEFKYAIEWLDSAPDALFVTVKVFDGATLVATVVDFDSGAGPSPDLYQSGWLTGSWQALFPGSFTLEFKISFTGSSSAGGKLFIDDLVALSAPPGQLLATYVRGGPILYVGARYAIDTTVVATPSLTQTVVAHPSSTIVLPIQFTILPNLLRPSLDVAFIVHEAYLLSREIHFEVTLTRVILSIPIEISTYDTYQRVIPTKVFVFPSFISGVGSQGVGGKVVLTTASGGTDLVPYIAPTLPPMAEPLVPISIEGLAIHWKLTVILDGVDISARLTGPVTVDEEEGAAAVAIFSILPTKGNVDPYSWFKVPVTIDFIETDSAGTPFYTIRLFSGIVDTPEYSVSTRVCQFTCTDDLQGKINSLTNTQIDAHTPSAKWSKFLYSQESLGWDYLQQRLETYPYTVSLDRHERVIVKDWRAGLPSLEFTEGSIIDQSLSVSLANAKDLSNWLLVGLDFQQDIYREDVLKISWEENMWLPGGAGFNQSPKATPQMIVDAVQASGAVFIDDPWWEIQPASQWLSSGLNSFGFLNWGEELLTYGFRGLVAKRYKQSMKNSLRVLVQSATSISGAGVGHIREYASVEIAVEYAEAVDQVFFAKNQITKYVCTAGPGLTQGKDSDSTLGNTRFGLFGSSYPNLPVTFEKAEGGTQYFGSSFTFADYSRLLDTSIEFNMLSGPAYGHLQTGQHVYNFDRFIVRGTKAEREEAMSTLTAQATRTILASHRQNRVGFTTPLRPSISRGDTIRVDTTPVKATGVVYQLVHTLNVDDGTAFTSVTLALSSARSVGFRPTAPVVFNRTIGVVIVVIPTVATAAINPPPLARLLAMHGSKDSLVDGVVKSPTVEFVSSVTLGTYTHSGTVNPTWTGHITPATTGTFENKEHTFVVDFPEIPEASTENTARVMYGADEQVDVPQDELFLLS